MSEKYITQIKCYNCKSSCWLQITKGVTIEEYGESDTPMCNSCNCPLIKIKEKKDDTKTEIKKDNKDSN